MASASNTARLCLSTCRRIPRVRELNQRHHRPQHHTRLARFAQSPRLFSTTTAWLAKEDGQKADFDGAEDAEYWENEEPLTDKDLLELRKLSKPIEGYTAKELAELHKVAHNEGFSTIDEYLEQELEASSRATDRLDIDRIDRNVMEPRPNMTNPLYDEEDDELIRDPPANEADQDDMPDFAHAKAHELKQMRHYARLAVWEMPLLSKLAKPFELPKDTQPLRWRYTTYFGEAHPAEKKVVVQFCPDDLKLTPAQALKMKKLAGTRYNPETQLIKMNCEAYEHPAQNKRYLLDLVDKLIAAAKDPKDMFEDIPLDTRHHKFKKRLQFPKEWKMTQGRKQELADHREKLLLEDKKKVEGDGLVDGQALIDQHYLSMATEVRAEKDRVPVGVLRGGPASNRTMRARP